MRADNRDVKSLGQIKSACGSLGGIVPGTAVRWSEAAELTLERREGAWWLLISPTIWTPPASGPTTDENRAQRVRDQQAVGEFIRNRRATRYNRAANTILNAWVKTLCAGPGERSVRAWNLGPSDGIDPTFEIDGRTAYSRPLAGTP